MFKRSIGKELTTLDGYEKDVIYIKNPLGAKYFVDTPQPDQFNRLVATGYHYYEVIDEPYPKEVSDWVHAITDADVMDGYDDIYTVAEKLIKCGYSVVKL